MWTLAEAQPYVSKINDDIRKFQYHAGIIGSVITKTKSNKDLDIVLLPYDDIDESKDKEGLQEYLNKLGATCATKSGDYSPVKILYKLFTNDGQRIDFFIY